MTNNATASSQDLDKDQIERALNGVIIPPQPTILVELNTEQASENPDLIKIAELISADVGLSAAVLKTVNSALYGLSRPMNSIRQAVLSLGLRNISSLVTSFVLRQKIGSKACIPLDTFWESAKEIAEISLLLAKNLSLPYPEDSYTIGLFHDCGIALMAQEHADYNEVYSESEKGNKSKLLELENQHYQTNHTVISFYLCKSWKLTDTIAKVVRDHHNRDLIFEPGEENINRHQLMAILKMADNISHNLHVLNGVDHDWELIKDTALAQFELSETDYFDLTDEVIGHLD